MMQQPMIAARRRSCDFRAADRCRADLARRGGAAGAMAVFPPVNGLLAIGCALHEREYMVPFVGKLFFRPGRAKPEDTSPIT
jgi:hypothetical protein